MPRPRALSDQAIREIRAARKYRGPFKRASISLAALAHRYNVSVPLISKTLAGRVKYASKAAPSDVVKTSNLPGRRNPMWAPARPLPAGELMPLIVCAPASGMHYLVGADALDAFKRKYPGVVYPCKHLPAEAAKRKPAAKQVG